MRDVWSRCGSAMTFVRAPQSGEGVGREKGVVWRSKHSQQGEKNTLWLRVVRERCGGGERGDIVQRKERRGQGGEEAGLPMMR